jgi:hypothetical protein
MPIAPVKEAQELSRLEAQQLVFANLLLTFRI